MTTQPVYIRQERNAVLVCKFGREPHQRHYVAQFDVSMRDIQGAKEWVRSRQNLQLVCAISGKPI